MTFEELVAEYEDVEIGSKIWQVLQEVTGRVCRRYPPSIYADSAEWSESAIDDLAQSVALERLLAEGQLEFVFLQASDLRSLEGLMGFQVKRTLAHRRTPSVVDRLVTRIRRLLDDEGLAGIESEEIGSDVWLTTDGGREPAALVTRNRSHGVNAIADVPRIPSNPGGQRESKVFSTADLVVVVQRLTDVFEGLFLSDLRKILEDALTSWLPELLYDTEGDHSERAPPEHPVEIEEVTMQVSEFVAQLDDTIVTVIVGKSSGVSDGALADQLGCSRPTVAKRKSDALRSVEQDLLSRIPAHLHERAVTILIERAIERTGGQRS